MKHLFFLLTAYFAASIFLNSCKKSEVKSAPVLTTTAASNITSTSAQVGGTIKSNGGSQITQSGIVYALHNNPTLSDSIVPNSGASTGSFTVTLNNLTPNTSYFACAYATNGDGTSYGTVDSFKTSAGFATIMTTSIGNNQALMATSGWSLTNNGGTPITAIGLCWSTSPNPTISNLKTSDNIAAMSASDTLRNLNLTTYYVRAYVTNGTGTAYGNQITFTVSTNGTVVDIDGNAYATVTIGTQSWMASNLRVTHYQNGDSVVNGFTSSVNWTVPTVGAYIYPNGDSANKTTYGLLYNPPAVNDTRNLAPAGWHVATLGDWETLEYFEGMAATDTGFVGIAAVGTLSPILSVGGSSGLNLPFPGNYGGSSYGSFGITGYYWTSKQANAYANYYRAVFASTSPNYPGVKQTYTTFAMAVRCVKN